MTTTTKNLLKMAAMATLTIPALIWIVGLLGQLKTLTAC